MESNQDQICFPHRGQPVQDAVSGYDGNHEKWTGQRQDWSIIYAQPVIFFGDRIPE